MVNRRQFVSVTGAAVVAGLAGCSSNDSQNGGNGSPGSNGGDGGTGSDGVPMGPEIEAGDGAADLGIYRAAWDGQDTIEVDSDVQVAIVVGNRGGEATEFVGEVTLRTEANSMSGSITTDLRNVEGVIEPGEKIVATSEVFNPKVAGAHTLDIESNNGAVSPVDGAEIDLPVSPHEGTGEDTLQIAKEVQMSVDAVRFEQALHYDTTVGYGGTDRVALVSTDADETFVVVQATVQNNSDQRYEFHPQQFAFAEVDPVGSGRDYYDIGSDLDGVRVDPGSDASGYLLFRVAQEVIPGASLRMYRDSKTAATDVIWDLDFGEVAFPQFELVDVDVPEQYRDTNEYEEFRFTVANTGEATGTFRGELEWREEGIDAWENLMPDNDELVVELEPGAEETLTVRTEYDESAVEYRFDPFGETFTVTPE